MSKSGQQLYNILTVTIAEKQKKQFQRKVCWTQLSAAYYIFSWQKLCFFLQQKYCFAQWVCFFVFKNFYRFSLILLVFYIMVLLLLFCIVVLLQSVLIVSTFKS